MPVRGRAHLIVAILAGSAAVTTPLAFQPCFVQRPLLQGFVSEGGRSDREARGRVLPLPQLSDAKKRPLVSISFPLSVKFHTGVRCLGGGTKSGEKGIGLEEGLVEAVQMSLEKDCGVKEGDVLLLAVRWFDFCLPPCCSPSILSFLTQIQRSSTARKFLQNLSTLFPSFSSVRMAQEHCCS